MEDLLPREGLQFPPPQTPSPVPKGSSPQAPVSGWRAAGRAPIGGEEKKHGDLAVGTLPGDRGPCPAPGGMDNSSDQRWPPATPVFPQLQQPWEPEGAGGLEG